jgi:zinc and cadmium transporter
MNSLLLAILASIVISLISMIGVVLFKVRKKLLKEELISLVGLATGALLGDAVLHLIPEAFDSGKEASLGLWIIGGMLIFFCLEKFLKWRHCHNIDCHQEKQLAWMSLATDSIHNFIDGLIIGGSFLSSIPLGISTSLAIVLHEIPQEIGDLAILIHGGFSIKKASLMNLMTAFFNLAGVLVIWTIGRDFDRSYLLALTAGGFIYLAASDLIPELHRHESRLKQSLWQLITVILGVVIMYLLV